MIVDRVDAELRAAASELRMDVDPTPPQLPGPNRSRSMLAAGALLAVAAIGSAVAVQHRLGADTPNQSAGTQPAATDLSTSPTINNSMESSAPSTTQAPTTTPTTPAPPYDAGFERVESQTLTDWIGTWTVDFQPAIAYLGSTGQTEYALDMTDSSFCIKSADGGNCMFTDGGIPMPEDPQGFVGGSSGGTLEDGTPFWNLSAITNTSVDLQFYAYGSPACEMHSFPLTTYGDAVVWACESTTPVPDNLELAATKGRQTLISTVEFFGPSADYQRPDPVEVTGAAIGDPIPNGPAPDPTNPPYWVAIGDSASRVVGYSYGTALFGQPSASAEALPIIVYDEAGSRVGVLGAAGYIPDP